MSGPLISVILPTRNRAHSLLAALASVLQQTWRNLEVLVVDDASTDGTAEVLQDVTDPRVRYVRLEQPHGASGARNAGIAAAQGEWIAFQDSDDLWMPDKLRRQLECALAHPGCIAVYTSYWRNDGTVREVRPRPEPGLDGDVLPRLARGNFITTQTLMVRADVVRSLGGFDGNLPALNDWDFVLRLAPHGPVHWVPEPLVDYCLQSDSLTASTDRFIRSYLHILDKHRDILMPDARAEAWHRATIGSRLCREGDRKRGREQLALAWRMQPFDPRYAGACFFSWLPSPAYRTLARVYAAIRSR